MLGLILESGQPVGAYALLDRLRALRAGAAPPTVYRALDFLLEHGLIHKVERLNAFVACAEAPGSGHVHRHADGAVCEQPHAHPHQFLICRHCGSTAEIADPAVTAALARAAAAIGFAVARSTVEVEGTCARCAGAGLQAAAEGAAEHRHG